MKMNWLYSEALKEIKEKIEALRRECVQWNSCRRGKCKCFSDSLVRKCAFHLSDNRMVSYIFYRQRIMGWKE